MIYSLSRNKEENIGFSEDTSERKLEMLMKPIKFSCSEQWRIQKNFASGG
jgi:hypothetical protein